MPQKITIEIHPPKGGAKGGTRGNTKGDNKGSPTGDTKGGHAPAKTKEHFSLFDMYVQNAGLKLAPTTSVEDGPEVSMRSFCESTGFSTYLDAAACTKAVAEHPDAFVAGALNIRPGYRVGTVFSPVHKQDIIVTSLNRAFNGDRVTVFLLPGDAASKSVDYANWQFGEADASQPGPSLTVLTTSLFGIVVGAERAAAVLSLPCRLESLEAREPRMVPVDRRYPTFSVNTQAGVPLATGRTYDVVFADWLISDRLPYGRVVSASASASPPAQHGGPRLTEETERDRTHRLASHDGVSLDQIAEHTLRQTSFAYNFPPVHDSALYMDMVDANMRQLAELTKLSPDQLHAPESLERGYFERVLSYFQTREFADALARQGRRSFCETLIFTIDPTNSRDFDDAVHLRPILREAGARRVCSWAEYFALMAESPQDFADQEYTSSHGGSVFRRRAHKDLVGYEVGVHIADTTHYLRDAARLDEIARETTTSVYLTDRCCPMLPAVLSNGLCSLNPLVPRYTFSVVAEVDLAGRLLPQKVWYGKSLIFSYCRLDYVAAQRMIAAQYTDADINASTTEVFESAWPCVQGYAPLVAECVRHANVLAIALRAARSKFGALAVSSAELQYACDVTADARIRPSVRPSEEAHDSHELIEEFMLVANQLVARRLFASFPSLLILRRHPPPRELEKLNAVLARLHYPTIDGADGNTIVASLRALAGALGKRLAGPVLQTATRAAVPEGLANLIFMSNSLSRAEYCCSTSEALSLVAHWGIHAPLYMHFTSPIRRYADDVAHKLLQHALEIEAHVLTDGYRAGDEYRYRPHEVVFAEPQSLYEGLGCVPPARLLLLAGQRYTPNSTLGAGPAAEGGPTTAAVVGHLLDGQGSGDVAGTTGGAKLNKVKHALNLIKGMFNRRELYVDAPKDQSMVRDMIARGRGAKDARDGSEGAGQGPDEGADEARKLDPLANAILDAIERDLGAIGLSFEALHQAVEQCNEKAVDATTAEAVHRKIMLRIMLDVCPEYSGAHTIATTVFVVKIKSTAKEDAVILYCPEFDIGTEYKGRMETQEDDPTTCIAEGYREGVPVEKQVMERGTLAPQQAANDVALHAGQDADLAALVMGGGNGDGGAGADAGAGASAAGTADPSGPVHKREFTILKPLACRIVPLSESILDGVGIVLD